MSHKCIHNVTAYSVTVPNVQIICTCIGVNLNQFPEFDIKDFQVTWYMCTSFMQHKHTLKKDGSSSVPLCPLTLL